MEIKRDIVKKREIKETMNERKRDRKNKKKKKNLRFFRKAPL